MRTELGNNVQALRIDRTLKASKELVDIQLPIRVREEQAAHHPSNRLGLSRINDLFHVAQVKVNLIQSNRGQARSLCLCALGSAQTKGETRLLGGAHRQVLMGTRQA